MAWAKKKFPALGHMSTIQCHQVLAFPFATTIPKNKKKERKKKIKVNKSFLKLQSG